MILDSACAKTHRHSSHYDHDYADLQTVGNGTVIASRE
jgi:hypothetical protein